MKSLLIAALFFFPLLPANADRMDDSLETMFKVTEVERLTEESINLMVEQEAARSPEIKKIKPEFRQFMLENVSWPAIKAEAKKIYRQHFTYDEIDSITKFYESSAGKKALQVLPQITAQGMAIGQQRVKDKLPAFLKSIREKSKKESQKQKPENQ